MSNGARMRCYVEPLREPAPSSDHSWLRMVCHCCHRPEHVSLWRRLWERVTR